MFSISRFLPAKMNLRKGSKVWVDDRNLAWIAAEITDFVGKQVQVVTASGKKVKLVFFFSPCLCIGGDMLLC